MTLLTIVAESILKDRLVHEIRNIGAKGFTITDVSGEGSRHRRVSELLGDNVKIEIIVKRETADKVLEVLQKEYFISYAVIAYMSEIQIVRENKYS